jgi:2-dehydro-3-deoxygalactonokinase
MTGELFALLAERSVLRHGLGAGWDGAAFAEAVETALSRPETLAAQLFRIRAEGLLHGLAPDAARARLSGLLIGAELASTKPYWLGRDIAIIGAPALTGLYRTALAAQSAPAIEASGDAMTRAGLAAARALI